MVSLIEVNVFFDYDIFTIGLNCPFLPLRSTIPQLYLSYLNTIHASLSCW